jgi:asparagine synthase (glutamine-hydrolysing)
VSITGAVITWDGRLDNREELIHEFGGALSNNSTDVAIVAAVYEALGKRSFAKFVGDWAVSIWDSTSQSLLLVKDFMGVRHLHYAVGQDQVIWCTVLAPLILLGDNLALDQEYIAGWLSFSPAAHLTPYVGIQSVPPASFVELRFGKHTIQKYWDFDPCKSIRYRADGEYEEHFREIVQKAVVRRLRSDAPVLAELSGGMDSSTIVCMADRVFASGPDAIPRVRTISYYNDAEPHWNEKPYFTKVEEQRGILGCHINVSPNRSLNPTNNHQLVAATPASFDGLSAASQQTAAFIASQGIRVLLSGIGGDEVLGGVPTPVPELANLLARAQLQRLAQQLKLWALSLRKPWFHLILEVVCRFLSPSIVGSPKHQRPANWIDMNYAKRHQAALRGYERKLKLFGPLPSFQENLLTLESLRRQVSCYTLQLDPPYDKAYPYFDRDLLEFLFAIPREQVVRPGKRRSLMRRALVGIVPEQILNRRRKAFVVRGPTETLAADWGGLMAANPTLLTSQLGIIKQDAFAEVIDRSRKGHGINLVLAKRTLMVECWLRELFDQRVLQAKGFESSPVLVEQS